MNIELFEERTGIKISRRKGKVVESSNKTTDCYLNVYYGTYSYNNQGKMPPLSLRNWVLFYETLWRCVK